MNEQKETKLETITLNDVEYVKKDDYEILKKKKIKVVEKKPESKPIKRFSISVEKKLLGILSGILTDAGNDCIGEEEAVAMDELGVVDPANVVIIDAKTEEAKRLLSRFFERNSESKNINWDFIPKEKEKQTSRYSMEYIDKFMEIVKATDDACRISMVRNHPIQVESTHFKCILAPRVEDNEDD